MYRSVLVIYERVYPLYSTAYKQLSVSILPYLDKNKHGSWTFFRQCSWQDKEWVYSIESVVSLNSSDDN